jgi:hypothetical protein
MIQQRTKTTITPRQPVQPVRPAQSASKLRSLGSWKQLASSRRAQVLAVIIIAVLPSLFFYHQSRVAEQKLSGNSSSSPQTTAEVVKRVSRHILLPSGEQPTVATVTDASKVRNQAFFASAASGDKVLIYAQAKKAYLYRPGIDRIVEVAPLAPNTTPNTSTIPAPAGQ